MVQFSRSKKKLNNGVRISYFHFNSPTSWEHLNPWQLLTCLNLLLSSLPEPRRRILLLFVILSTTSSQRQIVKLLFWLMIDAEVLAQMLPLTNFLYQTSLSVSTHQLPKVKKLRCIDFKKITFAQFLEAETLLQKQQNSKLLTLFFQDSEGILRKFKHKKALEVATVAAYEGFKKSLQRIFPAIFPVIEDEKELKIAQKKSAKTNWNEIIWQLSGGAMHMDSYLQLPVMRVFFEIIQKMKEADRIKSEMK